MFCPFGQENSEQDLNRQNTDSVSIVATSTTTRPDHPLRQLDAQFNQRVRIDCGSIGGRGLPEKAAAALLTDLIISTVSHVDRSRPDNRRKDNRQETVIVNA